MTAEDRYYVKKHLSRTNKRSLRGTYWCTCRHDWGKGRQPAVHYLWIRGDGELEHTTLCDYQYHLKEIRKQFLDEHVNRGGLMTERKKNVKLWQRLKAAHNAKVRAFAKKHGISMKQAQLELNRYEMMDQEDQEFLQQEGLR